MPERAFNEYFQRVLEQLVEIDSKVESLRGDVLNLRTIITGNGTPENGMIVRLDRLEQDSRRRATWTKAAIGASVTAIVSAIAAMFKLVKP